MLLMFAVVQAGLYFYARSAALATAEEGTRVAATETGTADQGRSAAMRFATRAGGGLLQGMQVSASRSPTTATVTVSARSLSVLPGLSGLPIRQTVSAPVERITG